MTASDTVLATVTSPGQLPTLLALVHDEPFVLREIDFAREAGVVRIPFGKPAGGADEGMQWWRLVWSRHTCRLRTCVLQVRNVRSLRFSAEPGSEQHTFNTISAAADGGGVVVRSNEGLAITIETDGLDLTVVETDRLWGSRNVWYLCGVEIERNRRLPATDDAA